MVLGPTASGKTTLAAELAVHYGTEVVSADSRQLYRELNIGVARPPAEVLQQVTHHFIASHSIHYPMDAAQYAKEAHALLMRSFTQHQQVILCGGSGLYIKALLEGFDAIPEVPRHIRQELQHQYQQHGLTWLQRQMELHDSETLQHLDRNNPQRLMRALEVRLHTGRSIRTFQSGKKRNLPWRVCKIAPYWPRQVLYERINRRVMDMVRQGLFDEAKQLNPYRHLTPLQTVGYEEVFAYLDGQHSREDAIRLIQRNTRRYAKRQLTWFRGDVEINWVLPDNAKKIFELTNI